MRHVHASGRFDATPDELKAALDFYALEQKADVITLTEVGTTPLAKALVAWVGLHSWDLHRPADRGPAECAILTRHHFDRRTAFPLTKLTLKAGRTAPIYLTAAHIQDGPWIGVWHSPAHNDGLNPHLWPTRVYLSALAGLKRARMRMHGGGIDLAGDWNIRPQLLNRVSPFKHLQWAGNAGQAPTEGGRVIDGVLTNLPVIRPAKTLPAQPGFDHRAVLIVLGRKEKKR